MILRCFLFSLSIYGFLSAPAKADPGPVVNWLMSERASLLDIGMLRLNMKMDEIEDRWDRASNGLLLVSASYEWENNRIFIDAMVWPSKTSRRYNSEADVRWLCDEAFSKIRSAGSVDPKTGQAIYKKPEASGFSTFFSHEGYVARNTPENLFSRLDKIFVLRLIHPTTSALHTCTGPLLDTGFSIKADKF